MKVIHSSFGFQFIPFSQLVWQASNLQHTIMTRPFRVCEWVSIYLKDSGSCCYAPAIAIKVNGTALFLRWRSSFNRCTTLSLMNILAQFIRRYTIHFQLSTIQHPIQKSQSYYLEFHNIQFVVINVICYKNSQIIVNGRMSTIVTSEGFFIQCQL